MEEVQKQWLPSLLAPCEAFIIRAPGRYVTRRDVVHLLLKFLQNWREHVTTSSFRYWKVPKKKVRPRCHLNFKMLWYGYGKDKYYSLQLFLFALITIIFRCLFKNRILKTS